MPRPLATRLALRSLHALVAAFILTVASLSPEIPCLATPSRAEAAVQAQAVPTWTDSLDFGTEVVGVHTTRTVILGNDGTANYTVSGASPPSAEFLVAASFPIVVHPGMTRIIQVEYRRTIAGTADGTLELSTNIGSMPILEVALVGSADPRVPAGAVAPNPLDFGTVGFGEPEERSAAVWSTGNVPLVVSSITVANPDVTVLKTVPFTVQPGNAASVAFMLTPTESGPFSEVVRIRTNANPDSILFLTLTADVAPPPIVSLDPAAIAPVELALGQTASVPISVFNLGEHWPLHGGAWVQVDSAVVAPTTPLPVVDLPQLRIDGEGHLWDVGPDGSITTGDSAAFAGGLDWFAFPAQTSALLRDGGRTIQLGPATIGPRDFTRSIHVAVDGAWVRYFDTVRNRTNAPITTRILIHSKLVVSLAGLARTSSGDASLLPEDDWVVVADESGPVTGHIFAGPGRQRPATTSLGPGLQSVDYDYDLVLGPGASVSILHFALQAPTLATAIERSEALRVPNAAALLGLSAVERSRIVNFAVPQALWMWSTSFGIDPLGSQGFVINFDTGATAGERTIFGSFRVSSNDPLNPLVVVPLELRVVGDVPDVVDVGPNGAGLALAARFLPNPASVHGVRLSYSLPTAGDARFELYDVRGRRLAARTLNDAPPGPGTIDWSSDGVVFAPGVYWTRLTHGGKVVLTKGVVLR